MEKGEAIGGAKGDPLGSEHPQAGWTSRYDACDGAGRKAIGSAEQLKRSLVAPEQSVGSGDPQRTVGSLGERADQIAAQLRRGAPVEESEVDTIEADEAAVGGQPQVAVASLADGMNCVLGQAIVGLPELLTILTEGLCRIERVKRARAEK